MDPALSLIAGIGIGGLIGGCMGFLTACLCIQASRDDRAAELEAAARKDSEGRP